MIEVIIVVAVFIVYLLLVGFAVHQACAYLFLLRKHRQTVRALLSVIREEDDEEVQFEQMKVYFERYRSSYEAWHFRLSPPRFPVYLQNLVYDLDHSQVERFQKRYKA
jgi:hypothetical protein